MRTHFIAGAVLALLLAGPACADLPFSLRLDERTLIGFRSPAQRPTAIIVNDDVRGRGIAYVYEYNRDPAYVRHPDAHKTSYYANQRSPDRWLAFTDGLGGAPPGRGLQYADGIVPEGGPSWRFFDVLDGRAVIRRRPRLSRPHTYYRVIGR